MMKVAELKARWMPERHVEPQPNSHDEPEVVLHSPAARLQLEFLDLHAIGTVASEEDLESAWQQQLGDAEAALQRRVASSPPLLQNRGNGSPVCWLPTDIVKQVERLSEDLQEENRRRVAAESATVRSAASKTYKLQLNRSSAMTMGFVYYRVTRARYRRNKRSSGGALYRMRMLDCVCGSATHN